MLDLNTGAQKTLVRGGSHAQYVPTGHLLYTAGGTLRAVRFDIDRLETRGTPVPVVPRVATTPQGAGNFALDADGTLVYADAPMAQEPARTLGVGVIARAGSSRWARRRAGTTTSASPLTAGRW